MKKLLLCLLTCVLLTGLTSCKLFKKPTVEKIHDIKVLSINPDKTTLEVAISVQNPNCYKLKLNQLDVSILNKSREKIGSATLSKAVEIPKKKANALNFQITLDTRSTIKMINHSDQKVFFYVSGTGLGKVLGNTKKFDFEEPYELDVKAQIQKVISGFQAEGQNLFQIKRSYVSKVGLTQSQIRVDFIIMNPYGLEFNFKHFPAQIKIDGKESGSGDLAQSLIFDEKVYSREGTLVFKISNWKSIINAVKGVFNGEISYEVKGKVQINAYGLDFEKPFSYKDSIAINISELIF